MQKFRELFEAKETKEMTNDKEEEMYSIFSKLTGFVRAGWDDNGVEFYV